MQWERKRRQLNWKLVYEHQGEGDGEAVVVAGWLLGKSLVKLVGLG